MIDAYCDGSCPKKDGPGGWAYVILVDEDNTLSGSGRLDVATNNIMELMAAVEAMNGAHRANLHRERITIISDSRYVVDGMMSWRHRWEMDDYAGIANAALWRTAAAAARRLPNLKFRWVKGHAGNHWNEFCDRAAANARRGAL